MIRKEARFALVCAMEILVLAGCASGAKVAGTTGERAPAQAGSPFVDCRTLQEPKERQFCAFVEQDGLRGVGNLVEYQVLSKKWEKMQLNANQGKVPPKPLSSLDVNGWSIGGALSITTSSGGLTWIVLEGSQDSSRGETGSSVNMLNKFHFAGTAVKAGVVAGAVMIVVPASILLDTWGGGASSGLSSGHGESGDSFNPFTSANHENSSADSSRSTDASSHSSAKANEAFKDFHSFRATAKWKTQKAAIEAANLKAQLDFTDRLRALAGEISRQTGAVLFLTRTEQLTLAKKIEAELISSFNALKPEAKSDGKDYGKMPVALLDINKMLKAEKLPSIEERMKALEAILSIPTVNDLKYIPADMMKRAQATLNDIDATNNKMLESALQVYQDLEARNNPQLKELMENYLAFATKLEKFQKELGAHIRIVNSPTGSDAKSFKKIK